jgi:cholest-4-en-3-one 26-monooxygenase
MTAPRSTTELLADINLLDLDRWAREGAPHHWFARLRDIAPVWRHPSPAPAGQPGFWVISGYDQVARLGRCPHALSSDDDNGGVTGLGPGDELEEAARQSVAGVQAGRARLGDDVKFLLTLDPPEHTAYRKLVTKGFTPRMIGMLEVKVRSQVDRLLAAVPAGEPFDVAEKLSMPLPMRVIGDMIGAPASEHDQLLRWSNEAVAATDPEYRPAAGSMQAAVMSMFQYFTQLRSSRAGRRRGEDDLISVLMDASVDGRELSPVRFGMFLFLLAVAGNETTRTAISHAVLALHDHPDQWARLRRDPTLISSAVEEVLRWASPVLYFRRNAVTPINVAGQQIQPGDIVSLWYVSANRDRGRFADPETFDVARQPNEHVTFGGGGPHFCLGASLARLELRVVLEELVCRYDRIEVTGQVERLRSNFLHGIKHLPVRIHLA